MPDAWQETISFKRQFATGQGALGSMGAGGGEGSYKSVPGYATWLVTGGAVKLHDIKNFGIADKTPWTEQKIAGPLASLVNSQKPNFVEKAMAQAYEDIAKNAKSAATGGSDSKDIARLRLRGRPASRATAPPITAPV